MRCKSIVKITVKQYSFYNLYYELSIMKAVFNIILLSINNNITERTLPFYESNHIYDFLKSCWITVKQTVNTKMKCTVKHASNYHITSDKQTDDTLLTRISTFISRFAILTTASISLLCKGVLHCPRKCQHIWQSTTSLCQSKTDVQIKPFQHRKLALKGEVSSKWPIFFIGQFELAYL